MRPLAPLLFALAATTAQADPTPVPSGQVIALSPEEIEATLDAAATRHNDPFAGLVAADPALVARNDRSPHGEVGAFVGTGGARGVYGTTVMPLGQNGTLGLSFSTGRFSGYNGYRDWRY